MEYTREGFSPVFHPTLVTLYPATIIYRNQPQACLFSVSLSIQTGCDERLTSYASTEAAGCGRSAIR